MPSANFAKLYDFTSVSPRLDHPVSRPSARWISRSESLLRMEKKRPEVGTEGILLISARIGHRARAVGRWSRSVLGGVRLAAVMVTRLAAQDEAPPVQSGS